MSRLMGRRVGWYRKPVRNQSRVVDTSHRIHQVARKRLENHRKVRAVIGGLAPIRNEEATRQPVQTSVWQGFNLQTVHRMRVINGARPSLSIRRANARRRSVAETLGCSLKRALVHSTLTPSANKLGASPSTFIPAQTLLCHCPTPEGVGQREEGTQHRRRGDKGTLI